MRLLHSAKDTSAQFDDPNLVSCAGLVPVMRLAQDCDLAGLVTEHLKVTVAVGANAHLKIPGIVAGMLAGADCIDDLDVLRDDGQGPDGLDESDALLAHEERLALASSSSTARSLLFWSLKSGQ